MLPVTPTPVTSVNTPVPVAAKLSAVAVGHGAWVCQPCIMTTQRPVRTPSEPEGPLAQSAPLDELTEKFEPALAVPRTLTTTLPEVASGGTVTTMLVALQLV